MANQAITAQASEAGIQRPIAAVPSGFRASRQPFIELWYLMRVEFANLRGSWVWSVLMASMFPLTTVLFFRFFMTHPSPVAMRQMITGNMVFPIIIMGINALSQDLSWAKHNGHFVFYASLPISKINFIVAKLTSGFLMTLPSVVIMAGIGELVFGITLHFSLIVLPVLVLAIGGCVGLGTLMGFLSPSHQLTNMMSQVVMMVLSFLTPVMIPMAQLPKAMQVVSYIFPTTYAADSLRTLFTTGWQPNVGTDILALIGYTALSLVLIIWKMDWRVER